MVEGDDFSTQALSILKKELKNRGLTLDVLAENLYKERISETLHERPSLPGSYSKDPSRLKKDIAVFVSNLIKARRESGIFSSSVDIRQLKKAFAKCGPHRIRC